MNSVINIAISDESLLSSPRSRFRAAMFLAVLVDAVQIIGLPLFGEGALSPLDDVLDFITAVVLVRLLGWHWEFLPSLIAELVPGVDLIPFWTLAVANVYRKWKQGETAGDPNSRTATCFEISPPKPWLKRFEPQCRTENFLLLNETRLHLRAFFFLFPLSTAFAALILAT